MKSKIGVIYIVKVVLHNFNAFGEKAIIDFCKIIIHLVIGIEPIKKCKILINSILHFFYL